VPSAMTGAAKKFSASYELPYMKHAPIGPTMALADVQSFASSKDGSHVALRRYAPADARTRAADLVVREHGGQADQGGGRLPLDREGVLLQWV
jgi:hypothetical protein